MVFVSLIKDSRIFGVPKATWTSGGVDDDGLLEWNRLETRVDEVVLQAYEPRLITVAEGPVCRTPKGRIRSGRDTGTKGTESPRNRGLAHEESYNYIGTRVEHPGHAGCLSASSFY